MKRLKNKILLGFNLGVLFPTLIYFLSLWYYGFMTSNELILVLTTPRAWMLFVLIYFPLLNFYINHKLKIVDSYLDHPNLEQLSAIQKTVSLLPKIFIINVMIYATTGASSLVMVENFFTLNERILALILGFAFTFVYALPFFIRTIINIERWASPIPLTEQYRFLSVKAKLYINLLCNVFGVMVVIGMLNIGVIMSNFGTTDVSALYKALLVKNIFVSICCLIIVCVNLQMLSRQLINPIEETTKMFQIISTGDLTKNIKISSKDEIGILKHWIDTFVNKINDLIARVHQGAGQLDNSAGNLVMNIDNIASSMNDMSYAANQIAISSDETCETIAEVVNSLHTLNTSIANIADHSYQANTEGQKTVEISQQGKQIVTNTIEEMNYIRKEMTNLVLTIERMGEAVFQIERIINMISDITRQTNMLAINATIEAARAGEHGKGFGVVADSISKLSEESKVSTKQIANLVTEIREIVQNSISKTKESVEKVDLGVELVKETNQAFDAIFEAINLTTNLVHEIAVATDKQANESQSIMDSIQKVNDMSLHVSALVQEQVAATEEVATTLEKINSSSKDSTAQKLTQESKELYKLISQFKIVNT